MCISMKLRVAQKWAQMISHPYHQRTPNTRKLFPIFANHFGLWTRSLDIPLIFQLQRMCNNSIPFKEKIVAKAKMVAHGQLRTCYHLETGYLNVFFYRMYSIPMHKSFSGLGNVWEKGSRNDPKGMECLLSGEQLSTPGSSVWKRDDWRRMR